MLSGDSYLGGGQRRRLSTLIFLVSKEYNTDETYQNHDMSHISSVFSISLQIKYYQSSKFSHIGVTNRNENFA